MSAANERARHAFDCWKRYIAKVRPDDAEKFIKELGWAEAEDAINSIYRTNLKLVSKTGSILDAELVDP